MKSINFFKKLFYSQKTSKVEFLFYTRDIYKDTKFNIGDYTYGNPKILFENEESNLHIGKFCSIANGVTIFLGGNHRTDWITTYPFNVLHTDFPAARNVVGHPSTKGDVTIGHDVWIGKGATILSGVTIGDGAVIAAESVVSKDVGPYEIWGGNPARLLKKRFDESQIQRLLEIKWWDWSIDEINRNVHILCSNNINKL